MTRFNAACVSPCYRQRHERDRFAVRRACTGTGVGATSTSSSGARSWRKNSQISEGQSWATSLLIDVEMCQSRFASVMR